MVGGRWYDMIWEFGVLMSTDFSSSHMRLDALNFVVGELRILAVIIGIVEQLPRQLRARRT